jgi:cell division protein FtsQ
MTASNDSAGRSDWTVRMPRWHVPAWTRRLSPTKAAFTALAVLLAVCAFGYGMLQTSLFAVQRIDVNGLSHLQRSDVLALSHIKVGEAMISINQNQSEGRIEGNPWVQSAHVKDAWPHVVTINVVERTPVAQIQTADNRWAQVSSDGVVLAVGNAPTGGLPLILDIKPAVKPGGLLDSSTGALLNVAQLMPPSLQPHVRQMQNQSGTLRLGLDTGTIVILGDTSNMADKLMAAAAVVSQTDTTKLATLDVTSPHLPTGTPTQAATATAPTSSSDSSSATTSTTVTPTKSHTTTTSVQKSTSAG